MPRIESQSSYTPTPDEQLMIQYSQGLTKAPQKLIDEARRVFQGFNGTLFEEMTQKEIINTGFLYVQGIIENKVVENWGNWHGCWQANYADRADGLSASIAAGQDPVFEFFKVLNDANTYMRGKPMNITDIVSYNQLDFGDVVKASEMFLPDGYDLGAKNSTNCTTLESIYPSFNPHEIKTYEELSKVMVKKVGELLQQCYQEDSIMRGSSWPISVDSLLFLNKAARDMLFPWIATPQGQKFFLNNTHVQEYMSLSEQTYGNGNGTFLTAVSEACVNSTVIPTPVPTAHLNSTAQPTPAPIAHGNSTVIPTPVPTAQPTPGPTAQNTLAPSSGPTAQTTLAPSSGPTAQTTLAPSSGPTSQPGSEPTAIPTPGPTGLHSSRPTSQPTYLPSSGPTSQPNLAPSSGPTAQPTLAPTYQSLRGGSSEGRYGNGFAVEVGAPVGGFALVALVIGLLMKKLNIATPPQLRNGREGGIEMRESPLITTEATTNEDFVSVVVNKEPAPASTVAADVKGGKAETAVGNPSAIPVKSPRSNDRYEVVDK